MPPGREGSGLIRRLLFVAFFIEVGLLLIVVPWSGYWRDNYFVQVWPWIWTYLDDDFLRGAISGLGFLNLFAGFGELAPMFSPGDRTLPVLHDPDPEPSYRHPRNRIDH
jgi:hypothetical protein